MTNDQLGELLSCYARVYWSVSAEYVCGRIMERHPEVTEEQLVEVFKACNDNAFRYHCSLFKDGFEEPEIVVEHLFALGGTSLDDFLAARIRKEYRDMDEETIRLIADRPTRYPSPETEALYRFATDSMRLDDDWATQLIDECVLFQGEALYENKSWVMSLLNAERFGKIHFRTVAQVKKLRELGNSFYQTFPNPVFRGWRPCELEDAPHLPDDIPEKDEDIPDAHEMANRFSSLFRELRDNMRGGPNGTAARNGKGMPDLSRPVGRNDPCPCGSGKKYKKCHGKPQ